MNLTKTILVSAIVSIFAFFSLGAWALSSPIGSSPDENYHLASIWCAQGDREGFCETNQNSIYVRVPTKLIESSSCYAFQPEKSANCNPIPDTQTSETKSSNADGGYPPMFYLSMSLFTTQNIAASVITMRLVNSLIFVLLMLGTFVFLPAPLRKSLLIGVISTIVPLGMFLIPSVNPSSWAVTSAAVLFVSAIGLFKSTKKSSKIGLSITAGISVFLGAGARSDSAVYACIALFLAMILSLKEIRNSPKKLILPVVFIFTAALLFLQGGQSNVINPVTAPVASQSIKQIVHLVFENAILLPSLWIGAFGTWGLGWLDTIMPQTVWFSVFFIFAGFAFQGLRFLDKSKAVAVAIITFLLISIPLYILVHDGVVVGVGVQPRYIYPLLIIFAVLAAYNSTPGLLSLSYSKTQIVTAAALICVANSLSLYTNIRRYVTGIDVKAINLNAGIEWWWSAGPSPMSVWLIGSLAFALILGIIAIFSVRYEVQLSKEHQVNF